MAPATDVAPDATAADSASQPVPDASLANGKDKKAKKVKPEKVKKDKRGKDGKDGEQPVKIDSNSLTGNK